MRTQTLRYVVPADELFTVVHATEDDRVAGCGRPMLSQELWVTYPYDETRDRLCHGCGGPAPEPEPEPEPEPDAADADAALF